jgi:hypothetical protein
LNANSPTFPNAARLHPEVVFNENAIIAFMTEVSSPTVLTSPVPGDLWS